MVEAPFQVAYRPFLEEAGQRVAYQEEAAFQASNQVEEGREDAFRAEVKFLEVEVHQGREGARSLEGAYQAYRVVLPCQVGKVAGKEEEIRQSLVVDLPSGASYPWEASASARVV